MVDKVTIEELDPTVLESRDHRIPAMKDNVTVKLSVAQILSLIERGDLEGNLFSKEVSFEPDTGSHIVSDNVQSVIEELLTKLIGIFPQSLSDAEQAQARANIGGSVLSGFRNKIINGDFTINQRGGTRTPGIGVYGYDRWKGHASGLEQIIEGLPAGTYTLTFGGGGTGSVDSQTPAASPAVFTVAGGGNISVVVPATATRVSLVEGDATAEDDPFSPRHIQQELALCQRYYETGRLYFALPVSSGSISGSYYLWVGFSVTKRAIPSITGTEVYGTFNANVITSAGCSVGRSDSVANRVTDGTWQADAEL